MPSIDPHAANIVRLTPAVVRVLAWHRARLEHAHDAFAGAQEEAPTEGDGGSTPPQRSGAAEAPALGTR